MDKIITFTSGRSFKASALHMAGYNQAARNAAVQRLEAAMESPSWRAYAGPLVGDYWDDSTAVFYNRTAYVMAVPLAAAAEARNAVRWARISRLNAKGVDLPFSMAVMEGFLSFQAGEPDDLDLDWSQAVDGPPTPDDVAHPTWGA